MNKEVLIGKAMEAMTNAYAPYSHFYMGAALLTKEGKIYTGSDVEDTSGAVTCAERTAFFSAVSNGERSFSALAVVGGYYGRVEDFCFPCEICIQTISEFCDRKFLIYLYNGIEIRTYTLDEFLPIKFEV